MKNKHHKSLNNIDGFIPTQSSRRHVGFNAPNLDSKLPKTNIRRPRFHTQQLVNQSREDLADFSDHPANLSQLTNANNATNGELVFGHNVNTEDSKKRHGKFKLLRRIGIKRLAKYTVIILVLFILVFGGWTAWKFIRNSGKLFSGGGGLFGFLSTTKLKGEDQGRINLLLTGVSTDDPGHEGANLTDSIMLVSLDIRNNKATLLSIPRDLWVSIPGYGYGKINAANVYGDTNKFNEPGYPPNGNGLLEKVIHDNLQININYYAKINYTAFRDAVNAVGGIQINIKSPDPRGLYDPNINKADHGPLRLPNGLVTLDGQTALNLARARGDSYYAYGFPASDFDRTEHQRQMLIALKQKVTSTSVLANPVKLGQLFDALGNNIQTDFKTSEIRRAYDLGKKVGNSDIQSVSLNNVNGMNLLSNYTTPDGQSALIPAAGIDDFSQIQLALKKILSNDPVVRESATVVILNGGNITGLAGKEKTILNNKNINVVAVDTAAATAQTIIIDQSKGKMPSTKQVLTSLFGNNVSTNNTSYGYPSANFIIVLGANQKDVSSSPS